MRKLVLLLGLCLVASVAPTAGAEQTKYAEWQYVGGSNISPESTCEVEGTSSLSCLDVRGSTSMDVEIVDMTGQALGGIVSVRRSWHDPGEQGEVTLFCGSVSVDLPEGAMIATVSPINYALNPLWYYPCPDPAIATYGVIKISY